MKNKNIIPKLPASSGAFIIHQGKILLIKRDSNPKIPDPNKWAIIGGRVEKGESFDKALQREIKEEIGVSPKDYQLLGFFETKKDKVKRAIYLVKLSKEEVKKTRLGNEGQELKWFTPDEIGKIDTVPEIKKFFQKHSKKIKLTITGKIKKEEIKNLLKSSSQIKVLKTTLLQKNSSCLKDLLRHK